MQILKIALNVVGNFFFSVPLLTLYQQFRYATSTASMPYFRCSCQHVHMAEKQSLVSVTYLSRTVAAILDKL